MLSDPPENTAQSPPVKVFNFSSEGLLHDPPEHPGEQDKQSSCQLAEEDRFEVVMQFPLTISESVVNAVWAKAQTDPNYNPWEYRRDICGALIYYQQHGNRQSVYGWEVDHIIPVAHGGTDYIFNLQPLHWENNAAKGDGPLVCKKHW